MCEKAEISEAVTENLERLFVANAGILGVAAGFTGGEIEWNAEVFGLPISRGFHLHHNGVVLSGW
jgi:hypothetical protein